jgi:hypothetical protein
LRTPRQAGTHGASPHKRPIPLRCWSHWPGGLMRRLHR